jgi:hypothetical protein
MASLTGGRDNWTDKATLKVKSYAQGHSLHVKIVEE